MTVQITWYGHACFLIETGGYRLLTDPFITGNPQAPISADDVEVDTILVSHGHGDHIGDTVELAKRTGAMVVSNFEIQNWVTGQGVANAHPMHIGGAHQFDWGKVKLTMAQHGSSMPDGSYGGNPCGFLFYLEEKKIYHACDTGLFYDMQLIGDEGVDLAILPIGDNFTMGPEDALRAVNLIRPKMVVPIHYNTFDVIKQDPQAWVDQVIAQTDCEGKVMQPGDTLTLMAS
jgi:L-ascorbate metabolism protein UlaG (beta-lactamase superfamily)